MPASDFASNADYGHCPDCGGSFQIKRDGTLRHHAGAPGSEPGRLYGKNRAYRCSGVGKEPIARETP
jgi:hypothetical protein